MPNSQINLPPKPEPVKAVWGSTDDVRLQTHKTQTISTGIKFFLCCGGLALLAVGVAFGYYLIK